MIDSFLFAVIGDPSYLRDLWVSSARSVHACNAEHTSMSAFPQALPSGCFACIGSTQAACAMWGATKVQCAQPASPSTRYSLGLYTTCSLLTALSLLCSLLTEWACIQPTAAGAAAAACSLTALLTAHWACTQPTAGAALSSSY